MFTKDLLAELVNRGILEVGCYTYGLPDVRHFDDKPKLKIGNFCSIAPGVIIILGGYHFVDRLTTYPLSIIFNTSNSDDRYHKGDIEIGNDVWLSTGCTILSGVKIGDGAVIAAGAVISKDVEPYTVVAGNPQRVVKKRFSDKDIKRLLKIKWWDWDIDKIKTHKDLLIGKSVASLQD